MKLNNMEIRQAIDKRRLQYYEVAAAAGVNPSTLSRWLQFEMRPEKKAALLEVIEGIKL